MMGDMAERSDSIHAAKLARAANMVAAWKTTDHNHNNEGN